MAVDLAHPLNLGDVNLKVHNGVVDAGHPDFTGANNAEKVDAAIQFANMNNHPLCLVPDSLIPYDPTAMPNGHLDAVRMVREGQQREGFDLQAYGGDPDGNNDADAAIKAAIDACAGNGGGKIPCIGDFIIGGQIDKTISNPVLFVGNGMDTSSIQGQSTSITNQMIKLTNGAGKMIGGGFRDLRLECSGSATYDRLIEFVENDPDTWWFPEITRVWMLQQDNAKCALFTGCFHPTIRDSRFQGFNDRGLHAISTSARIDGSSFAPRGGYAIELDDGVADGTGASVTNNRFEVPSGQSATGYLALHGGTGVVEGNFFGILRGGNRVAQLLAGDWAFGPNAYQAGADGADYIQVVGANRVSINGGELRDGDAGQFIDPNTAPDEFVVQGVAGFHVNTETLSGGKTLTFGDQPIQKLDPGGAGRTITLPPEIDGLRFVIANNADNAEDLTVENDANTALLTVSQDEVGEFESDGSGWIAQKSSGDVT